MDDLSQEAIRQRGALQVKQQAAEEAKREIEAAMEQASSRSLEVRKLQDELRIAEKETTLRKAAIEKEIESVMPIVEEAKAAVGSIKRENLDEIRSFSMPPEAIADVLSAVLMLLGTTDTSWASMKKFLGNRGVKEEVMNYDARRITPKMRKAVAKMMADKPSSFDKEGIARASAAAAPLAAWVRANMQYSLTLEKVVPLENELAGANNVLESSQRALEQNERESKELEARLRVLEENGRQRTLEMEELKRTLAATNSALDRARDLLRDLSGERDRWHAQREELSHAQLRLPLVTLLAAGFVTYLGRCSEDVRAALIAAWQESVRAVVERLAKRDSK
ncbi:hypothetical protein EON62_05575, partial [archaeon]